MEGYAATGQRANASFVGYSSGKDFKDACKNYYGNDRYYNPNTNSYWGCGLYDNEVEAHKFYG